MKLLAAALAAQGALATPVRARSSYAVKETHNPPLGWTKVDRARAGHVIQLQIGLKQGNFEELEKQLYEGNTTLLLSHALRLSIRLSSFCGTIVTRYSSKSAPWEQKSSY